MKKIFFLLSISTLLFACKPDDTGDPCDITFDQAAMFTNLADHIIIPAFEDLNTKLDALVVEMSDFTTTPTESQLIDLRFAFEEAWLSWQAVSPYNFGPSEIVFLRSSVNNFPANTADIEANIAGGNYDFNLPDSYDKGFPALDYLLYGLGENDAEIVAKYQPGNAYSHYLQDVIGDIKIRVDATKIEWAKSTPDNYRNSFIQNTGTAAGTSLSLLINQLNENYEFLKRDRIGLPSGVLTLDIANPTKVEAFYSGISLELAIKSLEASVNLYTGSNGLGLDDLLIAAEAMKGTETLDAVIQAQFSKAKDALEALQGPLSAAVENDQLAVQQAYAELSQQLVHIKTDMPTVLCVAITYIDNPSDSD
jgi:predicted lipoprotein